MMHLITVHVPQRVIDALGEEASLELSRICYACMLSMKTVLNPSDFWDFEGGWVAFGGSSAHSVVICVVSSLEEDQLLPALNAMLWSLRGGIWHKVLTWAKS